MEQIVEVVKVVFPHYVPRGSSIPKEILSTAKTIDELSLMTGAQRKAFFEEAGVPAELIPVFFRALQHITAATHATMVSEEELSPAAKLYSHLIRVRTANNWSPLFQHLSAESVLGCPFVLTKLDASSPTRGESPLPLPQQPATPGAEEKQAPTREGRRLVGLRNQGSTCYLNSLLQALYHLTAFRAAIYNMPTSDDKSPNDSIPLALQRLFFRLESGISPVETTELTASFGWSEHDSFVQHDIHELTRILLDNLESKMKAHGQKNAVVELFAGVLDNFFVVEEANHRASTKEAYYDLQLVVKSCSNIYESFDKYFATEVLDGANKYCLEAEGKKAYYRAERGVKLCQLPPVLLLHLNRIDFDLTKGQMCKVSSRWEYYFTLDLSKYALDIPYDDTQYKLFAVLVHSGVDAGYGHYYVFVHSHNIWTKFNDETVTECNPEDVFGANFGGVSTNYWGSETPLTTNAYLLVYVRASSFESLMQQHEDYKIPLHLSERMLVEQREQEKARQERAEDHLYVRVHILTQRDLQRFPSLLTTPFLKHSEDVLTIRARKSAAVSTVCDAIQQHTGITVENQLHWMHEASASYSSYQLKTFVSPTALLHTISLNHDFHTTNECVLLVTDRTALCEGGCRDNIIITHHKVYDCRKSTLEYVCSVVVGGVATHPSALLHHITPQWSNLAPSAELDYGLEKPDGTVAYNTGVANSGDVFVWYEKLSAEDSSVVELPTIDCFLHYQKHKVQVAVHLNKPPHFPYQFAIEMSDDSTYESVQRRIAKEVKEEMP